MPLSIDSQSHRIGPAPTVDRAIVDRDLKAHKVFPPKALVFFLQL